MANFDELYALADEAVYAHWFSLVPLCDRARELIPPVLRVWEVLAKLAVKSWDDQSIKVIVANGEMTATDFTDGNHDKLFVNHLISISRDYYVCDPRYQGMLLGLHAIFPYHPFGDFVARTRRITDCLFIKVDDERITWIAHDGIGNQDWEFSKNMAAQWLRAWCSARKIQRAYHKYREYRENKL
jgi:hypothetical protein